LKKNGCDNQKTNRKKSYDASRKQKQGQPDSHRSGLWRRGHRHRHCATAGGVTAMSRNPGMFGKILTFMFVGMALAEGWAVIAWLVVK
jgi:hypothetical protein